MMRIRCVLILLYVCPHATGMPQHKSVAQECRAETLEP